MACFHFSSYLTSGHGQAFYFFLNYHLPPWKKQKHKYNWKKSNLTFLCYYDIEGPGFPTSLMTTSLHFYSFLPAIRNPTTWTQALLLSSRLLYSFGNLIILPRNLKGTPNMISKTNYLSLLAVKPNFFLSSLSIYLCQKRCHWQLPHLCSYAIHH